MCFIKNNVFRMRSEFKGLTNKEWPVPPASRAAWSKAESERFDFESCSDMHICLYIYMYVMHLYMQHTFRQLTMPINACGSAPRARFAANAVHELVTTSVAAGPLPFAILSFPVLVLEVLVRAHRCLQSNNAARISAHCLPRRACSARHASSSATRSSNAWGGQFHMGAPTHTHTRTHARTHARTR